MNAILLTKAAVKIPSGSLAEKMCGSPIPPAHNTASGLVPANGAIFDAVAAYTRPELCQGMYAHSLCLYHSGKGSYLAELTVEGGDRLLVATAESGRLRAGRLSADGSISAEKSAGPKAHERFPFMAALVWTALAEELSGASLPDLDTCRDGSSTAVEMQNALFSFVGVFESLNLRDGCTGNNPTVLTSQTVASLASGKVIFGTPTLVSYASVSSLPKTMGEAMKLPLFSKWREELAQRRTLNEQEKRLVPRFCDSFPVMEETIELGKRYILSKKMKRPMSNMMWRGITSYGKSTGVEQLAALLGLPLVRVTCHTTMETRDFLTDFVPDNSTVEADEIPSLETCVNCPDIAYQMLTGEEKDDATVEDVQSLLFAALAKNSQTARFKIVESELIRAMQHGWICEIQECSRIRDPGILVGLNEFDRAGARIPLCDGSFAVRHTDALVLYTDNVGYGSCRPVDPSVLRRMSVIIDSMTMDEKTVLDRVRYNVPDIDENLLKKMYSIWEKIQQFCKDNGIDEGCCSASELEMWAACVQMDDGENIIENCHKAVISKATSDPDDQAAILAAVKTAGCPESIRDILVSTVPPII